MKKSGSKSLMPKSGSKSQIPTKLKSGNIIPLASDPENDYIIISETTLANKWIAFLKTKDSKETLILDEEPMVYDKKFKINGKEYEPME